MEVQVYSDVFEEWIEIETPVEFEPVLEKLKWEKELEGLEEAKEAAEDAEDRRRYRDLIHETKHRLKEVLK